MTSSYLHLAALSLGVMSASKLVEKLELGVVDCQVGMVVIVILAVQKVAQNARSRESRVAAGSIPSVPGKVSQVKVKVGR
jgi:hypothetical protein